MEYLQYESCSYAVRPYNFNIFLQNNTNLKHLHLNDNALMSVLTLEEEDILSHAIVRSIDLFEICFNDESYESPEKVKLCVSDLKKIVSAWILWVSEFHIRL